MVNVCAFEVPPPGAALRTVTGNVPPVSRSPAGIAALSCVELTNVVVRALLLKSTTEPERKPEPFTVSVSAAPPAVLDAGEILLMIGAGGPAQTIGVDIMAKIIQVTKKSAFTTEAATSSER